MGDSLPPPAEFDLVDSYARLRGATAEIVLAEPKTDLSGGSLTVRLSLGASVVTAPAEADGARLTVRIPRAQLTDGTWSLSVIRPDGAEAPLAARLLVQGRRPLVLLWGAKPAKTQLPPGRAAGSKKRVAKAAGHALDRALTVLPPEKAEKVRGQARRKARKLLK